MYKLILADNTELTGFTRNGTNYLRTEKVDEDVFTDNLSTLTIVNEEDETDTIVMHNAELIQQVQYPGDDNYHLCFREHTEQELFQKNTNEEITNIQLALVEIYEANI